MGTRAEGAALRDLDGRGERFRQIGKQFDHLRPALEAVLGCQLPTVAFGKQTAFGNADQRVVRFVVLRGRKVRLVGGDQRHAFAVGEIDQHRFTTAFGPCAVTLQLDVEAVAEQLDQCVEAGGGEMALSGGDRAIERATGAASQGNDAGSFPFQPFQREPRRLIGRRIQEGTRVKPHQAAVTFLIRREQHDACALRLGVAVAGPMIGIAKIDGERATDDRLDAVAREFFRKLQRPKHVVGIGERQYRLPVGFRQFGEARDGKRAFQQRIGRMHVQVHEIEAGHMCSKVG